MSLAERVINFIEPCLHYHFPEVRKHNKQIHQETMALAKSVTTATDKRYRVAVISTHSEVLLSTLSILLARGDLTPQQVLIFVQTKKDIRVCSFDNQGVISSEWPLGFFDQ